MPGAGAEHPVHALPEGPCIVCTAVTACDWATETLKLLRAPVGRWVDQPLPSYVLGVTGPVVCGCGGAGGPGLRGCAGTTLRPRALLY